MGGRRLSGGEQGKVAFSLVEVLRSVNTTWKCHYGIRYLRYLFFLWPDIKDIILSLYSRCVLSTSEVPKVTAPDALRPGSRRSSAIGGGIFCVKQKMARLQFSATVRGLHSKSWPYLLWAPLRCYFYFSGFRVLIVDGLQYDTVWRRRLTVCKL